MVTLEMFKKAMDYMIDNYPTPYYWKVTEKSLVYYPYDENGGKGKRVVIPLSKICLTHFKINPSPYHM